MKLEKLTTTQLNTQYLFNLDLFIPRSVANSKKPVVVADHHNSAFIIDLQGHSLDASKTVYGLVYDTTSLDEIAALAFQSFEDRLTSTVTQLRFWAYLEALGIDTNLWHEQLGIHTHSAIKLECKRILNLPEPIQVFCHHKKMSFKQCLNLAHIPKTILTTVFSWKDTVQLTASYFDTWCRYIRQSWDTKLPLDQFLEELGLPDILRSTQSPSQRAKKIQTCLFEQQHPILTAQNNHLNTIAGTLPFPVKWDKQLETKQVDLTVSLKHIDEFDTILQDLKNQKNNLKTLLNLL